MKIVLTAIALSAATLTGASALSFSQVDDVRDTNISVNAGQAGNGLVSMIEAKNAGISAIEFNAADADGNGQLTPSEFRTLG